jgi:hypothetical protein
LDAEVVAEPRAAVSADSFIRKQSFVLSRLLSVVSGRPHDKMEFKSSLEVAEDQRSQPRSDGRERVTDGRALAGCWRRS